MSEQTRVKTVQEVEQEQQKSEDVWDEVCPQWWSPQNGGNKIEGVLVSNDGIAGKYGSKFYTISDKEGELINFFGSAVLDERLKHVTVGQMVKVEYCGTETTKKGETVKLFKVFHKVAPQ